jgi:hypothetical protein
MREMRIKVRQITGARRSGARERGSVKMSLVKSLFFISLCMLTFSLHAEDAAPATVLFLEQTRIDPTIVQWDAESDEVIHISENEGAFLILRGTIKKDRAIELNGVKVPVKPDGKFELKVPLKSELGYFDLNVIESEEKRSSHTFLTQMLRKPEFFSVKVKDADTVVQKSVSSAGTFPSREWVRMQWLIDTYPITRPSPWYARAQISALGIFPATGGNSYSPQVAWSPAWQISDKMELEGRLAASILKYSASRRGVATEITGNVGYYLDPFFFGGGLGLETWSTGGTGPIFFAQVGLPLRGDYFILERLFATYALSFLNSTSVHHLRLGVRVGF